jgi:pimeloyl-ACP methyl ester carboxylesterase
MRYDHDDPADPKRRARWEAFLKKTDKGYALKRDLHYRDNFKRALETGQSSPVPAFLWPMVADMQIPLLVIRGDKSNMFEPATLDKVRQVNPRARAIGLEGSHDLAGDNPDGLAKTVNAFLADNGL